jgi:hypothetical protein
MDKNKKYAVAGGYLIGGAFVPHAHLDVARAGKAKRSDPVLTVPGQRRQTKASHLFQHGAPAPLDDEPNTVAKLSEGRQVPVHPSMKSRQQRGAEANGFDTLKKASDPTCHDNADDQCRSLPSAMKR